MAKTATQEEYENLWLMCCAYADHQELMPGGWVATSLAVEHFRLFCRQKGWRLPAGFVRG